MVMGDALGDDEVLKVKQLLKSKAGILTHQPLRNRDPENLHRQC